MKEKTKALIIIFLLFSSILILSFQIKAVLSQTTTSITKPIQAAWISQNGTLYAGTTNSIYKSADNGQTWSSALKTIPNAVDTSCIFIASNGYIYYSADGNSISQSNTGLWRSTNQGQSWTRSLALSTSECIWGMDEDKGGNLFAGVYTIGTSNSNARIYKSTNNGTSWNSVYHDSKARHVHDVAVDKSNNYIYASIGDNMAPWSITYVIRSIDGGANWSKILNGMPQVVAIEITPNARLFGSDLNNGQIFRTTNDNSFTQVLNTGANSYCFWIRKNDLQNQFYAGFCGGEVSPRTSGIYVSIDDGQSWVLLQSLQAQKGYDGTTAASNFVQGIMYHDVVLNGVVQNGACLTVSPQPTPTPTPTPTPSPTPTPTPLATALQISANVTVTTVSFQSTTNTLYVNVTKSGLNYIQAVISKASLPQVSPLKVYINNIQENYTYIENADSWAITIMTP